MALQKAMVPIDLSGSIDTKTDEKLVLPTNLIELENGVFTKGSVITKRYGYDALGATVLDGTALPTGEALTSLEDELLAFGSNKLYSYASGLDRWIDRGGFRSVDATAQDLIRNENEQSAVDGAESEGLILYAWEDSSGGIRASVVDSGNDVVVLEDVQITSSGLTPRCVGQGKNLTVIYHDTVTGNVIKSRQVSTDSPSAFSSAVTVASDINTSVGWMDVCEYDPNNDSAVIAYADTSNTVKVGYITSTGALGTLGSGFPDIATISSQAEDAITIYADLDTSADIIVSFSKNSDSSGLKVYRLGSDLTTTATTASGDATEIKRIGLVYNAAGNLEVYYEHSAAQTYNHLVNLRTFDRSNNTIGSASVVMRSVGLVSRPFQYSNTTYLWVLHSSSLQPTYFLIDSSGLVLGKYKQSTSGALPTRPMPTNVINITSGIFELPVQVVTRLESRDNDVYGLKGISRIKADFVGGRTFYNRELGGTLVLGGGFLSSYDSQVIDELGFHIYPENVTAGTATSGGSLADGTYAYKVLYSYTDAKGKIYQSAPSVAVTQAAGGGNSSINTLTIPTLRITDHSAVTIEVYRTAAGPGSIYYKIGTVANSTSADTVSFADNGAINDTNLVAKQSLYTTGNVLANIAPPATSVMGTFGQRMIAVSSEDPQKLFYSQKTTGNAAIKFSDVFTITVPEAKGITGIQAMDEKLILFEENRIFSMTGQGPTPTGDQNDFSEPSLVTSDAGCIEPRSIVLIPIGILFQSNKGIYLLSRSLETKYLGAPVEGFNNQTITSAELLQDQNQVRFLSSDGTTLVYDYFFNKWSTFSDHQGNGATVWEKNGNYVYLRTDGQVWQQSTSYTDDGARFPLKLTTAWIKTNNIQGLQRCRKAYVLGDYKSKHNLRVQVGYNYENFYRETHNFNYSTDLGITTFGDENPFGSEVFGGGTSSVVDGVYQFRMNLANQKCESIRFSIEDGEDAGSALPEAGQSYSISNLMLEIGMKPTGMKLPKQKLN
jgi:hypothetical protein